MKKYISLTLFICCLYLNSFAQTQPKAETFTTFKNEIILNELVSFNMQYLLDEFTPGILYFEGIEPVETLINYNILMDGIQYYDKNNKLLKMVNPQPPDSVVLGDHVLIPYNEKGFIEVFHTKGGPLYLHRTITYFVEKIVRGAYGGIERTSAVDQVMDLTGLDRGGNTKILNRSEDEIEVRLRYRQSFLFPSVDGGMIELSNQKDVIRAFPVQTKQVNHFFKQNKIDFNSVKSMKMLAEFLHTL